MNSPDTGDPATETFHDFASTPAAPAGEPVAALIEPGTMLADRYRILALAGQGAMGEVYSALDLKLEQKIAIKTLPERVSRDPERLARLLREVRILRGVSHPFVCRAYDIVETGGRLYLTMEFIEGETLAARLARKERPPQNEAISIGRQIVSGLAAAHERGVLHRDLKPSNIMLDERGVARITDFGVASASLVVLGPGAREGTPSYMAPEQLSGTEATQQSDIYALGLCLYELFTGTGAFSARTPQELLVQRASPPPAPSRIAPGIDPALDRLILRCLDPDPSRRPRSARAIAAALPGGKMTTAAIEAAQDRADRVSAFRGELGELRRAGVLSLGEQDLAQVEKYHEGLLNDLVQHFDVDITERGKQISLGMRVISLVGALALGASFYFFFYRIWGLLSLPAQTTILMAAPAMAIFGTAAVAARDRSAYFTNIAAFFTLTAFILNLTALSSALNLRESVVAPLLFGLFALVLAYGYGLRLLLGAGLCFLSFFLASLLPLIRGEYWSDLLQPPEGFLFAGLCAVMIHARASGDRHPYFAPVYRGVGLFLILVSLLILGRAGHLSYLPFGAKNLATAYQIAGFATGVALVWFGISRRWKDAVYAGGLFLVIEMYLKFFEWWWDWMPRYLFFLVIALAAMGVLWVLRRVRGRIAGADAEGRP